MQPPESPPPSSAELQAYSLGKLDAGRAAAIEAYLADHPECGSILDATSDDAVVRHLRGAGDVSTLHAGPGEAATLPSVPAPRADATESGARTSAAGAAAPPDPASEMPAALANHPRYQLVRKLGEGGMGAVFLAEHRVMHRTVALKVIRTTCLVHPEAVERFRREVQAAARLSHPNIVTAHDAEEAGGTHFLAMEYVEGVALSDWLTRHGPLPVAEACGYVRQAALGLQYAHEKGMVHRDLKPHNLMRTPDGTIKILDFGLARFACEGDSSTTEQLTAVGTVMGTADYIAPEQAQDSRAADIRADIYSLGCTLYQLLAGRVPFPEGTIVNKISQHLADRPEPLGRLCPDLPSGLVQVVEKMMAKTPGQRYQTPAEVAAALGPFAGSATADSPRKRWLPLRVAAAVLLLLVGGALLSQIIIRIKNRDGSVTEIKAPPGAQVEILDSGKSTPRAPLDAAWQKAVAAMPAEQQLKAVADLLKERNPGFDGKVTPTIDGGVVTELGLVTHEVMDLSPVRALPELRTLYCEGTPEKHGRLADLAPLNGTKLTTLYCGFTSVSDLSPLKGLELTDLRCHDTKVTDLTPLKGMRLTALDCGGTPIADLSPLQGMKLTWLWCGGTSIADLSPLKGMPLGDLRCDRTLVTDLSPLKEMRPAILHCGDTRVSDLSPLKGMRLTELGCARTQVSDLSPLKGMRLKVLYCDEAQITDLSPLQGMPLEQIVCDFKPQRDAKVLRCLKTLEKINDKPAAEFWKEVDAKKP